MDAQPIVEVTVEVIEINNEKARQLGIKWVDEIKTGEMLKKVNDALPEYLPSVPSILSVADWKRYTALTADLKLLMEKGAAKIMSKPKLLTKSGTRAKFLVGGEIPIVVAGVTGGTVEWKEYGIKLEITPTVSIKNQIDVEIKTEVSRLDWANMVDNYPAIATREASSQLRVKSGETITIAGLVEEKKETRKIGIPLLMDIPIIGLLFSREVVKEVETTVMIFVTPEIVSR